MRFKEIDMGEVAANAEELFSALSQSAFQMLFNKTSDGLIIVDGSGIVRAINSAAVQINGLTRSRAEGISFEELIGISALDWSAIADGAHSSRKDFHATTGDGRTILTSIRYGHTDAGKVSYTIVTQRDLQVLDHLRRTASGISGGNVFKFVSDREIAPDFEMQRRLSPTIDSTISRATRALHQGTRLLLLGESGSGKTELARYLHRAVGTREEPFIQVNCGAIPENLFESEMFGYEKGAFTGALESGKKGLIEAAEGGTLFLDEVGEIPLASQAKLLKFLEEGVIQQIGGRKARRISTRVVSATNRDLWALVEAGEFRRDLYYRLAVITVDLPPLRLQPELADHLVDHFITITNRMRNPALQVSDACRARLMAYDFPGNIRELHNVIQHLSVVADDVARPDHLPRHILEPGRSAVAASPVASDALAPHTSLPEGITLRDLVRDYERDIIDRAIEALGSKRKAAKALGVDIGTIVRKTKEKGSK